MAIHPSVNSLTIEAVDEYLDVAEFCIGAKKQDGGIYGYPATLLLFCVINAIGESLISGNEPFRVLRAEPFNLPLSDAQIKKLEQWYRNPLAHNALIAPGVILSPEEGNEPFVVRADEPILIRVKALYGVVRAAWHQVDKSKMNSNWQPKKQHSVTHPIDFSNATPTVSVTATGSISVPILFPKNTK